MGNNRWRHIWASGVIAAVSFGWQAQAQTPVADSASAVSSSRNAYLASGNVRTTTAVEGDFIAVGGRVVTDQPIKGDAMLAGGSVEVRAPIGDDLRVAGGDVNIDTTVGGELHAAGGNVTLTKAAQIGQGASLAGGMVTINGKIVGRLRASAQRVVINGEVTGDATVFSETLELGPTARIAGELKHTSKELKKTEGAVVSGAVTQGEMPQHAGKRDPDDEAKPHRGSSWVGLIMGYLGLLAAGIVFLLLFPTFSTESSQRIHSAPWQSLAIGFGVLVGIPVLAVLLMITLLGIPLGIATFASYPLLLLMGYLAGAWFIAQRVGRSLRKDGAKDQAQSFQNKLIMMAVALMILLLISRLPFVGFLVIFLTTIAGIGATVLEWHRRRSPPPAATA